MSTEKLLAQIKDNLKKKKILLLQKKTKQTIEILNSFWDEKIIYGYSFYKKDFIKVFLKVNNIGNLIIQKINVISTSGRDIYLTVYEIKKLVNTQKNTFFFFSTSFGIISHNKAIQLNTGGVFLFSIKI